MRSRLLLPLLPLLALALALAGCDQAEPVTSADAPAASLDDSIVLNGYEVSFLGTTAVPGGTEFAYRVTGITPGPPALDWFFLENACGQDALSLTPPSAVVSTVVDGVRGYKWTRGLGAHETRIYAYAFAEAPAGAVQVKLRRGGVTETAHLPGPCGGLAVLAGSVFVNSDDDPARSAGETGIPGVLVEVYDGEPGASPPVASATTGTGGAFAFTLLRSAFSSAGYYTVHVPESADGAFNAALYASYDYVLDGTAQRQIVLDGDVSDADLGFDPDRGRIILDLSEGDYQTDARSIQTWRGFIRDAQRGRPCDAGNPDSVCRDALVAHLRHILDDPADPGDDFYLLSDPFQGPPEAGEDALLDWALTALSTNPGTDVEAVARKLLAMQLNNENGWGTGDPQYEEALQGYLEAWVSNNAALRRPGSGTGESGPGSGGGTTEEERMADAYLKIGGGGGGTIEE